MRGKTFILAARLVGNHTIFFELGLCSPCGLFVASLSSHFLTTPSRPHAQLITLPRFPWGEESKASRDSTCGCTYLHLVVVTASCSDFNLLPKIKHFAMLGNHAWFSFSVFVASVPGPAVFWEGVIQFHFIRGRLAL